MPTRAEITAARRAAHRLVKNVTGAWERSAVKVLTARGERDATIAATGNAPAPLRKGKDHRPALDGSLGGAMVRPEAMRGHRSPARGKNTLRRAADANGPPGLQREDQWP
jgi:hypothetical protein